MPAGASGIVSPAGISSNGVAAALDGDTGVRGSGGPEALRASGIPPWAAIDNRTDSTQNPMVFIAPLFTPSPRVDVDVTSALNAIASKRFSRFAVNDASTAAVCCQASIVAAIVVSPFTPVCALSYIPRNYRALRNFVASLDPSPPTPLPRGEGSVERVRIAIRFRNDQ